jgi:hypothetical protein
MTKGCSTTNWNSHGRCGSCRAVTPDTKNFNYVPDLKQSVATSNEQSLETVSSINEQPDAFADKLYEGRSLKISNPLDSRLRTEPQVLYEAITFTI